MQKRELRLLEGAALGIIAVLIVGLLCVSALQMLILRSGQSAAVISAVLVDLANGDRVLNSLGTLAINQTLVRAAQAKANDMAEKSYFAHNSPEGYDSWHWFKEAGYTFSYAGENLALDFSDSADVERAWMQSASHRENLLDPHFTEIGIALAQGTFEGRATTFVVQMFAAPAVASSVAQPIQEITTPQDATEPALATTQSTASVLGARPAVGGASAEEPAPRPQAAAPIADIRTPSAEAPIGAIVHTVKYAPAWGFLATSPKTTLRYAYYALGLLIILALLVTTGLELRWHHRRAFVTAACLLVFMSGLFIVADYAIFSEPVLADTTVPTESG